MNRCWYVLVCCMVLSAVANSKAVAGLRHDRVNKSFVSHNDPLAEQRATGHLQQHVFRLPEDGTNLYLTVAGHEQNSHFRALVRLFQTSSDFDAYRGKTHLTTLSTSSRMFYDRYSAEYDSLPVVRLQTSDGQIVMQLKGTQTKHLPTVMQTIKTSCHLWQGQRCGPRGCPKKESRPPKKVAPKVTPPKQEVPRRNSMPIWLLAVAGVVGMALGFVSFIAREMS